MITIKRLLISIIIITLLSKGCGSFEYTQSDQYDCIVPEAIGDHFKIIDQWGSHKYYIVYAVDTKVMYFLEVSGYSFQLQPLYNSDGTLQTYDNPDENDTYENE